MNAPYYTDDAVTLHHGDSLDVCWGIDEEKAEFYVCLLPCLPLKIWWWRQ